jgi:outer membrane protein OmpA-like peptidoglycan-associated protein
MRKLFLGAVMATTILANHAHARDGQFYIEGDVGAGIAEDTDVKIRGNGRVARIQHDTPWDAGIVVGKDFGGFRLEADVNFREAKNKNVADVTGAFGPGWRDYNDSGKISAWSGLVNALVDLGKDDGLQAFAGGGIGFAATDSRSVAGNVVLVDDRELGLAFQGLAGVRYPISSHVDLGLKYRYYTAPGIKTFGSGEFLKHKFVTHTVAVTLAYNVGGAEPPAPAYAPPPPPPPPPPPVVECNKGPYIVFFDWDKSDITPEAATVLDNAVTAYGNCASVPVMLAGHADRSGKPRYNQGLSERRNTQVRGYLTARGIADGSITSQAFGESMPRVPTADGVRELQNRRVEITYGPGSGN